MWKPIYATGIKWISIVSNLSSVLHMHFTECKIIQSPDIAPAFLQLLNKTVVLSEFIPPQGMLNWKSWMGKQQQLEDQLVYQQNHSPLN